MFAEAYPITRKKDCDEALKRFIRDYGAPDAMITDGSKEQTKPGTAFQAILQKNNIVSVVTPPHCPNYNPAETVIQVVLVPTTYQKHKLAYLELLETF